jgi:hypothetical protein
MAVNPFTGEDDGVRDTLQPIVSNARSAVGNALFGDPASRSALLQIGLGLMQPVAMGQSVAGHVAQGIGGGGEAEARLSREEFERQKHEDELDKSNRTLDIRQQEANAYSQAQKAAAARGATTDRIALEQLRQQGREKLLGTKNYSNDAYEIYKRLGSPTFDTKTASEADKRFINKNPTEIANMLRADDAKAGNVEPPPGATAGKPKTVRQNGVTYTLQPDGSYQ